MISIVLKSGIQSSTAMYYTLGPTNEPTNEPTVQTSLAPIDLAANPGRYSARKPTTKLSNCGANNVFQEYETTSISMIPDMDDGTKVMVTSKVNPDPLTACTMMLYNNEEDPCCNKCQSGLLMGNILLDSTDLVCAGTNYDYADKCAYHEGDTITVYGTVSGSTIKV